MKIKLIISFILILTFNIFSQGKMLEKKSNLSEEEKAYLAYKYYCVQVHHDRLMNIHKIYQDKEDEFQGITEVDYQEVEYYAVHSIEDYKMYLDFKEMTKSKIKIKNFNIYNFSNTKVYSVAVSDNGEVFLLQNFWKDELQKFIKNVYGKIDSHDKLIEVTNLLLNTVYYYPEYENIKPDFYYSIIDKNDIEKYKIKYELLKLEPLKIEEFDDWYRISFYIVIPYSNEIVYYSFFIKESGKIKMNEQPVVIKENTALENKYNFIQNIIIIK